MPVKISVHEPTRFVIDATGEVTGAEGWRALEAVQKDSRFARGATLLVVAHGVTATPETEELRDLAVAAAALRQSGLAGFAIVTDPGFVYGVARMFSALADIAGLPVDVFQDRDAALRRLDELSNQAA